MGVAPQPYRGIPLEERESAFAGTGLLIFGVLASGGGRAEQGFNLGPVDKFTV